MSFLSFLLLAAATYLIWRITDQLPDLIFRISEIQRDVAELRRTLTDASPVECQRAAGATYRSGARCSRRGHGFVTGAGGVNWRCFRTNASRWGNGWKISIGVSGSVWY